MLFDRKLSIKPLEIRYKEIPKERGNIEQLSASQVSARSMTPKFMPMKRSFSIQLSVHTHLEQIKPVQLPEYSKHAGLEHNNEINIYKVQTKAPQTDQQSVSKMKLQLKSMVKPIDKVIHKSKACMPNKQSISSSLVSPLQNNDKLGNDFSFYPVLRISQLVGSVRSTRASLYYQPSSQSKARRSELILPSRSALKQTPRASIRSISSKASATPKAVRFSNYVHVHFIPVAKDQQQPEDTQI